MATILQSDSINMDKISKFSVVTAHFEMKNNVFLSPSIIAKVLSVVITLLTIAQIGTLFVKFYLGHDYAHGFIPAFDFDTEGNIPSLYSACSFLVISILMFVISIHAENNTKLEHMHWRSLALLFFFLCFDEGATIHEKCQEPIREIIGKSSFFNFEWVIFYLFALCVIASFFIKFYFKLPYKTKLIFFISLATFLSGAVGMEAIGSKMYYPDSEIGYAICYTIEEFLEMTGVLIFIYALLDYMENKNIVLEFKQA